MKPPLNTYRILDKANEIDERIQANHVLNPKDGIFIFHNWEMYSPEEPKLVAMICLSPGMMIFDITKQVETEEREVRGEIGMMTEEKRWLKNEN